MPKLKSAKCFICRERIHRHDANRMSVIVGHRRGQRNAHREVHLRCSQEVPHSAS
ncbi:hypothetical protein LCGC14_0947390 [marine sediment metagenome]|uniref:Uncharacterized protein n=1 Tax=marine sediment metagenome TaxID=412755 RepID=A0A0F9NN39_9ZZZZ